MGRHCHRCVPIGTAVVLALVCQAAARSIPSESSPQRRELLPSIFDDIEWNVNFAMLLLSLLCGILWISYISLYNSRISGSLLTRVARALLGDCEVSVRVGSFSFSALTGKVMFRDLWLFTEDYTIRVLDGALIFRYWLPVNVKTSYGSSSRTRLTVLMNGLEVNVYNQLYKYRDLELFLNDSKLSSLKKEVKIKKKSYNSGYGVNWLLEMFPQIHVCISSGRFTLGNSHLPTTLFCSFENVDLTYYALDSRDKDEYSGSCENVSVSLVKSLGFTGPFEPPPRLMGRGFEVLQSSHVTFKHCHVPILRSDSSSESQAAVTFTRCNILTLLLGKGTSVRYGPWADKQRDSLYNFFYPINYSPNCDYSELASRTAKYMLQVG
ncbi:hypothetical protein TTRE_0000916901 [Trichuris trichiura]|uniref:Bridge-like lipid transfer protein family member 1 N-terminal domain-containing protein n=1 Tax=Trichuris trichiura TaxID=36087 RepID=A0A077ZPV1_TRITR|nr:hypothetical protein TTRE_0000916901 [Trichuris trichiura]